MSKKGLIGVQMSTVAGLIPTLGAYGIMKAIHEAGYNCVEISQFPMTPENVAAFKQACEDFGMTVSSISAAVAPMVPGMPGEYLCNEADFKKMVADAKALNCDMMRIGMLPFKQLKELKMACAQYGPTAPFTQAIIEALGNQNLPPNDWKQVARACLS